MCGVCLRVRVCFVCASLFGVKIAQPAVHSTQYNVVGPSNRKRERKICTVPQHTQVFVQELKYWSTLPPLTDGDDADADDDNGADGNGDDDEDADDDDDIDDDDDEDNDDDSTDTPDGAKSPKSLSLSVSKYVAPSSALRLLETLSP
jgi:hypothetical protein